MEEEVGTLVHLIEEVLNLSNQRAYYPKNPGVFSQDSAYRYIRGAILEALVLEIIGKGRFDKEYSSWLDDCEIQRFPGNQIISIVYSLVDKPMLVDMKRKQNIDIAAWDDEKGGEFFECKLSPNSFKQENAKYLQEIYAYLKEGDELLAHASSLGGITLDTTDKLKITTSTFAEEWFVSVGRDWLFELGEVQIR